MGELGGVVQQVEDGLGHGAFIQWNVGQIVGDVGFNRRPGLFHLRAVVGQYPGAPSPVGLAVRNSNRMRFDSISEKSRTLLIRWVSRPVSPNENLVILGTFFLIGDPAQHELTLGVHPDQSQRRAQLVGDVGQKRGFHPVEFPFPSEDPPTEKHTCADHPIDQCQPCAEEEPVPSGQTVEGSPSRPLTSTVPQGEVLREGGARRHPCMPKGSPRSLQVQTEARASGLRDQDRPGPTLSRSHFPSRMAARIPEAASAGFPRPV